MPIIGINYDKCNNCGICLTACPIPGYFYSRNIENNQVIYDSHGKKCRMCGQCIAQCPEDAIDIDFAPAPTPAVIRKDTKG